MDQTVILNGNRYSLDDDDYIIVDEPFHDTPDAWYRVSFPIGNIGLSIVVQASSEESAIENIGDYIHENYDSDRYIPRVIYATDTDISEHVREYGEDSLIEIYYPCYGGQYWIDQPAHVEKLAPIA